MDVVWYCTVKRVSSMGLALSTSFRLKMLIVTWAFVSCPAPDRPTQSRPIVDSFHDLLVLEVICRECREGAFAVRKIFITEILLRL